MSVNHREVISFWFEKLEPSQWFTQSDEIDLQIKEQFSETHRLAALCELSEWRVSAMGRLAEIIVLDQFSRNIYRNQAKAFQYDSMALCLAQEAIKNGSQDQLSSPKKAFLYMPFMHSESSKIHEQAINLYSEEGLEYNLDFEIKHKEIIDRFGRYPHRNEVLCRKSTPEEINYLKNGGKTF